MEQELTFDTLVKDPITRLVMASDGVSEAEFVALLAGARRALALQSLALQTSARGPQRGEADIIPFPLPGCAA